MTDVSPAGGPRRKLPLLPEGSRALRKLYWGTWKTLANVFIFSADGPCGQPLYDVKPKSRHLGHTRFCVIVSIQFSYIILELLLEFGFWAQKDEIETILENSRTPQNPQVPMYLRVSLEACPWLWVLQIGDQFLQPSCYLHVLRAGSILSGTSHYPLPWMLAPCLMLAGDQYGLGHE